MRMLPTLAVGLVSARLLVGLAVPDAEAQDKRIELSGFDEVPVVVTGATGELRLSISQDELSIDYVLPMRASRAEPSAAHIHLGQQDGNHGLPVHEPRRRSREHNEPDANMPRLARRGVRYVDASTSSSERPRASAPGISRPSSRPSRRAWPTPTWIRSVAAGRDPRPVQRQALAQRARGCGRPGARAIASPAARRCAPLLPAVYAFREAGRRWPHGTGRRHSGHVPTRRGLRGQDFEGRNTGSSHRAADQVRVGDQHEDREGPRSHDPAGRARAGGRGHSVDGPPQIPSRSGGVSSPSRSLPGRSSHRKPLG